MIRIRRSDQRGVSDFGWLDSRHSFSFGHYHDPDHMGYGPLRVINDDWVAPSRGFDTHGHADMEIISYVLAGALAHRDSTGRGSVLRYGDVQRMSAGRGIRHSEHNDSDAEPLHFLQIWIIPAEQGLEPSYEEKRFDSAAKRGRLCLVASPDGADGALRINADARVYAGILADGETLSHAIAPGRRAWLQVAEGSLQLNGQDLREGDGAALSDETQLELKADTFAEILLFDLE